MERLINEPIRTNNTHPRYDKVQKWLPVIAAAEKHLGNVMADLDPTKWMDIRLIATQLYHQGQRKTDELAGKCPADRRYRTRLAMAPNLGADWNRRLWAIACIRLLCLGSGKLVATLALGVIETETIH